MKLKASEYRDGTSHRHRLLAALKPEHFVVDDRTLHDFIQFAQAYAKELRFYESGPGKPTDWTGFLSSTGKQFIEDAVRFIEQPEAIVDVNRRMELRQPHRVLFWVFLLLLRYPQQQLNALTKRYLEFYYRDCLQLQERPSQPDQAHVIFELAQPQPAYCLKKGTLLGTEQGQSDTAAPVYRLDNDSVITAAQVAKIYALTLKKEMCHFATFYHSEKRSDDDFANLLQWTLERASQQVTVFAGHEKVATTSSIIDMPSLIALVSQKKLLAKQEYYILKELAFPTVEDFKACLQWHQRQATKQTQQIYTMMTRVYQNKITLQRYQALKSTHCRKNFIEMLAFALGGQLPPLPDSYTEITSLIKGITDPVVMDYVSQQLSMTIEDFKKIIEIVIKNPDINANDWETVYQLVERAQARKQGYPDIGIEKITHLCARVILDNELAVSTDPKPFNAFDWLTQDAPVATLGFVVSSPLLHLREGTRQITLTLDCQRDTFHPARLNEFLQHAPFAFQLSGAETGFAPSMATVSAGSFFLETALAEYSPATLNLICSFEDKKGQFNENDKDSYLRFEDGHLYQIKQVISAQKATLRSAGFLPSKGFIEKYKTLTLTETGSVLSGLQLEEGPNSGRVSGKNSKKINMQTDLFPEKDHFKQYILWTDGKVYQIDRVVNPKQIEVVEYAYLPEMPEKKSAETRLYSDIKLTETAILTGLTITGVEASEALFTAKDVGNALVWRHGQVFAIKKYVTNKEIEITREGQLPSDTKIKKYSYAALFLNALQFTFTLDETAPAMTTPPIDAGDHGLTGVDPTIKITLKAGCDYEAFKTVVVDKYKLAVNVQGVKDLKLRNDESLLTNTALLQPFGDPPTAHAGFYWANPEICDKTLDSLDLHITWSGLPDDFSAHYAAYNQFLNKKIDNACFQTQLTVVNNRLVTIIGKPQRLFPENPGREKLDVHTHLMFKDLPTRSEADENRFTRDDPADDPLAWPRYFKLELSEQDFLHRDYPRVLNKMAQATATQPDKTKNALDVYPPYTPIIRDLAVDYTASTPINLVKSAEDLVNETQLFQLHPFGSRVLDHTTSHLLPQFSEAGYLYIGLKETTVPTPLPLLFQIIPSESDRLEERADMTCHYLGQHDWVTSDNSMYRYDKTDGLTRSGIISFDLPASANQKNPLMPTGLHWLCGSVKREVTLPQIVAIKTQAASVTLAEEANDEHYYRPLPAYSINQLVIADPQIKAVVQPYASFGGRARESHQTFWQRTSERLRHKHRAISSWDYEHIVLEAFPQLYKVKCLTQTQLMSSALAKVIIVVIPDADNSESFLPLKPKAPRYLLEEIKTYLSRYISPFVDLEIKNPSYEQIRYRVAVRFNKTCEQGDCIAELNEAIKRFLSPWAYESTAEVTFGSYIHNSLLIHFIEKQPYVDYVAQLKLIEHIKLGGDRAGYSTLDVDQAQVHTPDTILVSAPEHIIELVKMSQHQDTYFEGIGYMIIGEDFIVY